MYILNMDLKILLPLILMIESSFQNSDGDPNCNYNKVSHGTFEECCPKCTQDKEKCRYDCPIGYYRFGKRCNGILQNDIEHSKPFSLFVCYQKCPKTHYGITLNGTKVCVSCSILCLDTFIETSCFCASFERETDTKLCLNWIIANAIIGSILLAVAYILISCCFRNWKADKRRNKAKIYKCCEVTFAAETLAKTKSEVNIDQQGLTFVDVTTNEPNENVSFDRKETTVVHENNFEVQTDPINVLRGNNIIVHKFDRESKASTNSYKSTSSSNSKSAESDVSNASYKTAPSESPRLSEFEDTDHNDYNKDLLKAASSSDQTEEETGYENIPYLSEMRTDLTNHFNIDMTKRNELNNDTTIDINSYSVQELTSILDNVKDNQLVTSDNRVSSGSDLSFHSIHNQCIGLESQDVVVKYNEQHITNTTYPVESIDMKTITSQTNMSFNNSTINLVINQSN